MKVRYLADPERFRRMTTRELRDTFLVGDLFSLGSVVMHYFETDRTIVGSAVPVGGPLTLEAGKALAAEYFAQRREVGAFNVGGSGTITVDGKDYAVGNRECLYIGRGSKGIRFASDDSAAPAMYYLVSYPAHAEYPTTLIRRDDAEVVDLGAADKANVRTIYKYVRPPAISSCQLVMGYTQLAQGQVWNTMAAHTHERRTEVYLYFDVADGETVFHFMGPPTETRHLVVRNRQALVSPSWSIHSGSGTSNYCFIWAMGGENQEFTDMDHVGMDEIR